MTRRAAYREACRWWRRGVEAGLSERAIRGFDPLVTGRRPSIERIAYGAGFDHARGVIEAQEAKPADQARVYVTNTEPDPLTWALCLAESKRP